MLFIDRKKVTHATFTFSLNNILFHYIHVDVYVFILAQRIRISEILPWDKNLILPMLSYPGRQVTSSCGIAS